MHCLLIIFRKWYVHSNIIIYVHSNIIIKSLHEEFNRLYQNQINGNRPIPLQTFSESFIKFVQNHKRYMEKTNVLLFLNMV